MDVLVIGGTGYLGRHIAAAFQAAGHHVRGLARSAEQASTLGAAGVAPVDGDLLTPDSLVAASRDADVVVHAGAPLGDLRAELAAVDALHSGLTARTGLLLYTSGTWVLGPTGEVPADEDAPLAAPEIVAWRPDVERLVLGSRSPGSAARGVVIRPGVVHGHGGGIPAVLVALARSHGVGRFVGDPTIRWSMVHVDDLATLYVLARERATAGSVFHAVSQPGVSAVALAAAADVAAGRTGRAAPWALTDAAAELGVPFAEVLAMDQVVSGRRARVRLGWRPAGPPAIDDLLHGSAAPRRPALATAGR